MPVALSDQTIATVKATVPALEQHGLAVTRRMYERLFRDAAIRELFNQSHHGETGSQPKALAAAVLAYARNIDDLGILSGAVERIAQKHVALNILPEHYPAVAEALLGAIGDVLGDAATSEVMTAWGEAYWCLADILMGREATVYHSLANQPGGWQGWRDFAIDAVTDESSIIRSFTLVPADLGPVVPHKPGQYLGLSLDIPEVGIQRRNYSISCGPNRKSYRISVKREALAGVPAGVVSNWMHDKARAGTVLKVAPPAGEFFLDTTTHSPVVLLSGGVGLTPMVSMLEAIVATQPGRRTFWVHGALNGEVHAMRDHVQTLAASASGVSATTFYTDPLPGDTGWFDISGRMSASWLAQHTPTADAVYFLCGPKPFLRDLILGLGAAGVSAERIRYEFFGPADELLVPTEPPDPSTPANGADLPEDATSALNG